MKCLALDFGGSSVKYALVDHQARLECSGKLPAFGFGGRICGYGRKAV